MLVVHPVIREVNCPTALGERPGICVEQREAQGGKNRVDFPEPQGTGVERHVLLGRVGLETWDD